MYFLVHYLAYYFNKKSNQIVMQQTALDIQTEAYQRGLLARRSRDPEPKNPYHPDVKEYAEFARGFCHDPFPDLFGGQYEY